MIPFSTFFFLLLLTPSTTAFATHTPINQHLNFNFNFSTLNKQINNTQTSNVLIRGNSTILSTNRTFELGFFSTNGDSGSNGYLGIWYTSIPTPTRVWVANRVRPFKDIVSATLEITEAGRLGIRDSNGLIVWESSNAEKGIQISLSETGNLVLWSPNRSLVWQSFDYPTDTWLAGMNITTERSLTSWRSLSDPSPSLYSLRLKPFGYNEFELVYNHRIVYWSTGNWTGNVFDNVPEMTIPYIYRFHFMDPYRPNASFWYTETALESSLIPPLTRFYVDYNGQLKQFTWSPQTENWNMFWSQPENVCRVYSLCGSMSFCNVSLLNPCVCLSGFRPVNEDSWGNGDYSSGCERDTGDVCQQNDNFEEIGALHFDGTIAVTAGGSKSYCESSCLLNCSCIGVYYNDNSCDNLYGSLLNMKSPTSESFSLNKTGLYVRVPRQGTAKKSLSKIMVLVVVVGAFCLVAVGLLVLLIIVSSGKKKNKKKNMKGDEFPPMVNLKLFSYKELHETTRGFSSKIGHGGFGTVFQGELSDSSIVAVKRLERPGTGEKEFKAEVCTIGNIHHVNLVRLRGFCSENSQRLLVYDYMPNGALSLYLRQDGPNLSWEVRFRIAIGTAKGIAYLHEECRYCIIHCDIKPENILLDVDYTAKVSDFGLAKLIGRDFSRVLATTRGTWGYVAPEWISGLEITTKVDIYSYGMTLLELLSGRRNVEAPPSMGGVANHEGNGDKWFFPPYAARQVIEGNYDILVDPRLCGIYNREEAKRVAFVAIWCIQDNEETRPMIGDVVKMLEGVVKVTVPPPPKLLQAFVSGESYRGIQVDSDNGESTGSGSPADKTRVSNEQDSRLIENASSPVYENVKFD